MDGRVKPGHDNLRVTARRTNAPSPPLVRRRVHDQPVERFGHPDLTGEARGRLHLEGGVKLLFFLGRGRADNRKPFLVHMHQAGRAGAGAPAFGDDAGNVVAQRGLHHGRADLGLDRVLRAVVFDVGDLGHWARTKLRSFPRKWESRAAWKWRRVALGPRLRGDERQKALERRSKHHATPSFFCRLVDEVVYWNTSFFSGKT